jgi:hypothetical protein
MIPRRAAAGRGVFEIERCTSTLAFDSHWLTIESDIERRKIDCAVYRASLVCFCE